MRSAPSALVGSCLIIALFVLPARADGPAYGWIRGSDEVTDGYVLFAPLASTKTYLIDNFGRVVYSWPSSYRPGASVYLTDNGDLLRTGAVPVTPNMGGGGFGGILEFVEPSGEQSWQYELSSEEVQHHHDVVQLPNGNLLLIAWELKSDVEALAAGRNPASNPEELWPEMIVEVEPSPTGGSIVWEWHVWDHLIQDYDESVENYGAVEEHPELVDINFGPSGPDWLHFNAIAYNEALDQILVTVHSLGEIWIIDHSTTTEEAASHEGGASGMGGDLLYRWGNPQSYRAGTTSDRRLFGQHNAHWIPEDFPGAGNILIFNNGAGRPGGARSTVDEIAPPLNDEGGYDRADGAAFGPEKLEWTYDPEPYFYASFISGAQRTSNGNTLVCAGPQGRFFEVDSDGEIVWEYRNPVMSSGPLNQSLEQTLSGASFRATRIEPDHPGLEALDLEIGEPLELYPHAMGDVDNNGSVDLADSAYFESLFSGPCLDECADPVYPNALGRIVDFDSDLDVDCDDWRSFADAWTDTATAPRFGPCTDFLRGDANGNAVVEPLSDALFILRWMFVDGADPECVKAADVDGNGAMEGLSDALSLLGWGYSGGSTPPAPGPEECGPDPDEAGPLPCDDPPDCI